MPRPATAPRPATEGSREDPEAERRRRLLALIGTGQDRSAYPDAIRDWVEWGAGSAFRMSPDDVVARSQPRPLDTSLAAAHFELANHFWRAGERSLAVKHFNQAHRLQPDNWTYKRQAWSLVGQERVGGERGRFAQSPLPGEEADWPFESDFTTDVEKLGPGEYYPKTM
jgi:hypothetical protein